MSIKADLLPGHPSEVLEELYLKPLGMSAGKLAKAINVPRTRIERIVKGTTGMTPDTAVRLGRYFGSSAEMWLNLQTAWDVAEMEQAKAAELKRIRPLQTKAA